MNFLFNINVCRVCMQNEETIDLFTDKDLLEKFTYTTRLTISEEDNLPKVICSNCTVRLKIANKFIQTAHESESNLKNFLAKISNEFHEVTQSNKHDKTKDKNVLNSEGNLTKDEMLTLIGEDETPDRSASISSSKNEKRKVKRKTSPIKEPPPKNPRREITTRSKRGNVVKSVTSQNAYQKSKKIEDVSIVQSNSYEIEFENDANCIEEDEEHEEVKLQEEIHTHINQKGDSKIQKNTLKEQRGVENQVTQDNLKENEPDIENDQEQEHLEEKYDREHEDHEENNRQNHDTHMFTIHEESSQTSATELTELGLEENPLHQALDENSPVIEHIDAEQDGYLREYETILNNQRNALQYHSEFDENSSEETPLQDDAIYIQKLEEDHITETYTIADGDDEEQDDQTAISSPAAKGQKDKVGAKSSARKELNTTLHRFYCEQCNRDFSTKTNLNRHMQSHEGNKPHVCAECSKSFSQKSTLKQHMYTHTGERPYVCDVCDRGFTQCKSLIFHMRRHTGEKPFQCEYCLITFRQKDALRIHILKYHVITETSPSGKETYTCIICQKKFKAKSAFKTHMKLHTAITEPDNLELIADDGENASTVNQARAHGSSYGSLNTMFLEDENLDAAIMNVSASSASEPRRAKKFQCRKCFKCFALKKSLIRHMSIHYTNVEEDITECSDCDIQFDNVDEYQEHLTEQHQFACSACPHLVFKTIQELKIHMFDHDLDQQEQGQEELM